MNPRNRTNIIALAIVALVAAACADAQTIDLKLNLKQGQAFKLRLTQANSGAASVGRQGVNSIETVKIGMAFLVESVEQDGSAKLKVTFDKPSYYVSTTGQPETEAVFNPLAKVFAALDGRSFGMELTRAGVVRSVTGLEAAASAAMQSLAGQPEAVRTFVQTMFTQTMSEAMWKHSMATIFSVIPGRPVAIGERYSREFAMNAPGGTGKGTEYCKITERSNGVCKIKVYDDIQSADRQVTPAAKLVLSGTNEGTAEVQEATGLMLRARLNLDLKGKLVDSTGKSSSSAPVAVRGTVNIERYH